MAEERPTFALGNVEPREIVEEMKESFLGYANVNVNVGRSSAI